MNYLLPILQMTLHPMKYLSVYHKVCSLGITVIPSIYFPSISGPGLEEIRPSFLMT